MPSAVPSVIRALRAGEPLDELRAAAARLWLGIHGESADSSGGLRAAVTAWWGSRPGSDPWWDFLATRGACSACGEGYRYENLSICPECLRTYCHRHGGPCACGWKPVG